MDIYMLALRVLHIFSGVLWVGAAVFYLFLVSPTVKALGPLGGQFMQYFAARRHYPQYMFIVSVLTLGSGILLFMNVSGGLQPAWLKTGPGLVLTLGSFIGALVVPLGFFGIRPRAERLAALGQALATAGGPPTFGQAAEMHKLDRELTAYEHLDFIMLSVALAAMAAARYLAF